MIYYLKKHWERHIQHLIWFQVRVVPVAAKIHNEQIYGSPLPDDDSSMFEWGNAENVAGGGTKKALVDIMGNVTGTEFTYIKKYENIPLSAVPNTNGRAWQIQTTSLRAKFQNVILGKIYITYTLSSNLTGYETIYSSNSAFKPIINNGVLVFLGNTIPWCINEFTIKRGICV